MTRTYFISPRYIAPEKGARRVGVVRALHNGFGEIQDEVEGAPVIFNVDVRVLRPGVRVTYRLTMSGNGRNMAADVMPAR